MLDVKLTDSSVDHDNPDVYSGRIGTIDVTINHVLPSLRSADIALAVQSMVVGPTDTKSVLVTGVISGLDDSDINPGDLIINALTDRDEDHSESLPAERSLSQQAATLQREVGNDGRWLSSSFPPTISRPSHSLIFIHPPDSRVAKCPRLHYGSPGQDSQNSPREERIAAKSAQHFNAIAKTFENLMVDVVAILATGSYASSNGSTGDYATANAAAFAKELIRGMSDGLTKNIASFRGSETVVPPNHDMRVPPFEPQQFPRYGDAVLLVIPTANQSKGRLLREGLERRKPKGVILHSITVPFDSGVGEQPYNEAGVLGAHTRISTAVRRLNAPEYQETLASKGIGTILVASIENYIQLDNVERPTDYGVVIIHNASTGDTSAGLSLGVTVPPAYVDRARRLGFEGNPNYGRITLGQILAAHVPGLDKADFHSVLAGRSRYDLLGEVIGRLRVPW